MPAFASRLRPPPAAADSPAPTFHGPAPQAGAQLSPACPTHPRVPQAAPRVRTAQALHAIRRPDACERLTPLVVYLIKLLVRHSASSFFFRIDGVSMVDADMDEDSEDEFRDKCRLIDFAILDGYRTGLRHNPEGNLKSFQREFEEES